MQLFFGIKSIYDELCSRPDRFVRSLANSINTVLSYISLYIVCLHFTVIFCVVFVYCELLLLSVIDEYRLILKRTDNCICQKLVTSCKVYYFLQLAYKYGSKLYINDAF